MRFVATVALIVLAAANVSAGTISSLSPSSFPVTSGEEFITVNGTGLGDRVRYSGPAGTFELDINARTPSGAVIAWVPQEVLSNAGTYSLLVLGSRGDDSGPATFRVGSLKSRLTIFLPELIAIPAKGREGAFVKYEVTASGGDDQSTVINCEPASGSLFKLGSTIVRCAATDRSGERADGEFSVFAYDGVAPVLEVPKSFSVDADGPEGAVVKYETKAFDEIAGDVPVSCSPASGSQFRVGVTTVACTALDGFLNQGSANFDVSVLFKNLVIHVPDAVVGEADSAEGGYVDFEVTAVSPDDPSPKIKCDPESGSFFKMGPTTVTCVAEDRFGSVAEGRFDVTVSDTIGPIINNIVADPHWIFPTGEMKQVAIKVEPIDMVDPSPRCAITDVTANEEISPEDWRVVSDFEVLLLGKTTGKDGNRVYSVNVTCADVTGNKTDGNTNVTVSETEPPKQQLVTPAPAAPKRRAVGRR